MEHKEILHHLTGLAESVRETREQLGRKLDVLTFGQSVVDDVTNKLTALETAIEIVKDGAKPVPDRVPPAIMMAVEVHVGTAVGKTRRALIDVSAVAHVEETDSGCVFHLFTGATLNVKTTFEDVTHFFESL